MDSPKIDRIATSVKPFEDDEEYAILQRAAIDSWQPLAAEIVFFNQEHHLDGMSFSTRRVMAPWNGHPTIAAMVEKLAELDPNQTGAIVNADITLAPSILESIQHVHSTGYHMVWAGTSPRLAFNPDRKGRVPNPEKAVVLDMGLDFFIASGRVWKRTLPKIPPFLKLGTILWDNWLNSFFSEQLGLRGRYMNLGRYRAVFHPNHAHNGFGCPYSEEQVASLQFRFNGLPR